VDPVSAQNWTANDEYAKHLILANVSSSQLHHIDQDQTATQVWHSLISLHQATGFHTALTYMRSFYHMTAADDVNIPEYITNIKTLVNQINAMKMPFKIDNLTYAGILAQSLPAMWDPFIDSLFQPGMLTGDTSTSTLSVLQFQRDLKDEYLHRNGPTGEDTLLGAQQTALAITKRNSLAQRISAPKDTTLCCKNCKKTNHSTDQC
jgi:hypothetical protein